MDTPKISDSATSVSAAGSRRPCSYMPTALALTEIFGVSTDYLLTGKLLDGGDRQAAGRVFQTALRNAGTALQSRADQPLTQQELASLVAALLQEP